jgi:hypothetical protein
MGEAQPGKAGRSLHARMTRQMRPALPRSPWCCNPESSPRWPLGGEPPPRRNLAQIATLIEHTTIPTRGPLWRVSLRQILIAILARNQLSLGLATFTIQILQLKNC